MWAALGGDVEICRMLIEAGADIDAAGNRGNTALMFAAERGHAEVCRVLIEAGADPRARDCFGGLPDFGKDRAGYERLADEVAAEKEIARLQHTTTAPTDFTSTGPGDRL